MKFELRVYDMTADQASAAMTALSSIAANILSTGTGTVHLNGNVTGATSAVPMPPNGGAPGNDDDNGPANINAPSVDAQGFPWDERIHSKNKAMNADNTWRKRRGVDAATVASVEAALRGAAPQMPTVQQQPMAQQQPVMMQQPVMQHQPQFVPPMPDQQMQQPVMQQPPMMQQPQPGPLDFNGFMTHLAAQMAKRDQAGAPLITTDYLAGSCQKLSAQFGRPFNSITEISGFPDVINMAVNFITLDGRWN